jgi:hypothetical protein
VTHAIAAQEVQLNVAAAEAAVVYLAVPPQAPAKLELCQVPV